MMKIVANIFWFVFGGVWLGLSWCTFGIIACFTIIGIPYGVACFRIAQFAFFPYGKDFVESESAGIATFALNIIWIVFAGLWLAIASMIEGILWCCTIIGIPFGIGCFKLARISFAPLGKRIVNE